MMANAIDEYLDACDRLLAFDSTLRRRAREEIATHLDDALAADPSPDRSAAAQATVQRFGAPACVVDGLVAVHRTARATRAGWTLIGLAALLFLTMRIRAQWVLVDVRISATMADLVRLDRALFAILVITTLLAAYRLIGCRIIDPVAWSMSMIFGPASICASTFVALSIPARDLSATAALFLVVGLAAPIALCAALAAQFRILERYPRQTGS
jgi:hypothetical protein